MSASLRHPACYRWVPPLLISTAISRPAQDICRSQPQGEAEPLCVLMARQPAIAARHVD